MGRRLCRRLAGFGRSGLGQEAGSIGLAEIFPFKAPPGPAWGPVPAEAENRHRYLTSALTTDRGTEPPGDPHPHRHPRFAGDRAWRSHPRLAGDRGSIPTAIPDLPESGIQLSTIGTAKG